MLLMAYGTPDTLDNVLPYYTDIRGGREPAPELVEELRQRYQVVGGTTPLLRITEDTRDALASELAKRGDQIPVFLGMKHWHPFIQEAVAEMQAAGIERAVGLVSAPHYSSMSIAGYYRLIDQAQRSLSTHIDVLPIQSWHLHPAYLDAVAVRIRSALAEFDSPDDVTVIFTAHSLPQKILESGDPYPVQLRETSQALATMLGLTDWVFSYQSAGRTADPWLGPDLVDTVNHLADEGKRHVLVASVGFVSDHLEILYDIDYEASAAARSRNIELRRTQMLNASHDFVAALAELVRARLSVGSEV
ncbi:MAG: ferrochelatase [Chloroflexota bacterium]